MAFILIDPKRRKTKKVAKSDESQRVLDALDEYLESNLDTPVKWLTRFWKAQAAAFTYKELRSIVVEEAEREKLFNDWYQDYSRLIGTRMTQSWMEAFVAGAQSDPRITAMNFQVETSETHVREWIANRTGELVTACTQEQMEAIRYIIAEAHANRLDMAETARYLRPVVGLTEPQAAANLRYYEETKKNLRENHPRMTDESIEKKAREAAAKYAAKQQRYRAETIARTETAMAFNQGYHETIRQLVASGRMKPQKKIWSTARDGHVCSACQDLEGTETAFDDEFKVEVGKNVKRTLSVVVPPLHPRCKCALLYEDDESQISAQNLTEGLASEGEGHTVSAHEPPVLLETIDTSDENIVQSTLIRHERDIAESKIENAIVICQNGEVYQCFGDLNNVWPDVDLGDRLVGAWVTHNHPIDSDNEFSFSSADINLFMKYSLSLFRGIDNLFIYQLTRDPAELDKNIESVFDVDEYSSRHEQVISIARRYGIGYRRWNRE